MDNAKVEQRCNVPPEGWYCTREPGHDGPCAAKPTSGKLEEWFADAPDDEATLTPAQPEADGLAGELARLQEVLGEICRKSNPDWTEIRVYPNYALDDIHTLAVSAPAQQRFHRSPGRAYARSRRVVRLGDSVNELGA